MANHLVSNGKNVIGTGGSTPSSALTRERSFIRTSHQQTNQNKRRSLAFNHHYDTQQHQQQNRKAIEIYRPPSKLIHYNHR